MKNPLEAESFSQMLPMKEKILSVISRDDSLLYATGGFYDDIHLSQRPKFEIYGLFDDVVS